MTSHFSTIFTAFNNKNTLLLRVNFCCNLKNTFFLCVNGNAKVHDLCTVLIRQHDWSTLTWKTEKPKEGYTTSLHSIYYVYHSSMCSCMTMFAGSWLEVRRLLVWSAEAAACIKISSLGFRFCCHHSENHLYCSFRGLLYSKPSGSPPKKLFRWSFLKFSLDKGRNSKHAT